MPTTTEDVLSLLDEMTRAGAIQLVIDSGEVPQFVINEREVLIRQSGQNRPVATDDEIHAFLRAIAGDKLVDDYLKATAQYESEQHRMTPEEIKSFTDARIPQFQFEFNGSYFRLSWAKLRGKVMTMFVKLDGKPVSYWEAELNKVQPGALFQNVPVKFGQGVADSTNWLSLTSEQFDKVKVLMLELEGHQVVSLPSTQKRDGEPFEVNGHTVTPKANGNYEISASNGKEYVLWAAGELEIAGQTETRYRLAHKHGPIILESSWPSGETPISLLSNVDGSGLK